MKPVKIAMATLTHGHTRKYYQTLLDNEKLDWVASCAADPHAREVYALYRTGVPCYSSMEEMFEKQKAAVQFVAEKKDSAYHDLRARNLVENETIVVVSLLMLRDAKKDPKRVPLAERYILDAVHDFERNYQIVMSGDLSTIDRHRDVIDY